MDYLKLKAKRALVTGGTKGIGQAVVKAFRDAGAVVMSAARSQPMDPSGYEHFVLADISTREGAERLSNAVLDRLGASTSWCTS